MSKVKSRKSITKRFKLTSTGKILRRLSGQDHARSKKTSKQIRQKRKWVPLNPSEARAIRRILVS
ncbi:MAG: 50S ribosomal protein L35 [Candidatus Wildermuthbacteria bacterium]|nr:50S ribosomal protein L35 [Candidatus Wildermuthbacteria bacterium]